MYDTFWQGYPRKISREAKAESQTLLTFVTVLRKAGKVRLDSE